MTGLEAGAVIADKGYESNRVLAFIRDQGAEAVIPPKSNRREPWEYDRELYKQRNLIERAFNKLKQWRRIATRYDRKSSPKADAQRVFPVGPALGGLCHLGLVIVD